MKMLDFSRALDIIFKSKKRAGAAKPFSISVARKRLPTDNQHARVLHMYLLLSLCSNAPKEDGFATPPSQTTPKHIVKPPTVGHRNENEREQRAITISVSPKNGDDDDHAMSHDAEQVQMQQQPVVCRRRGRSRRRRRHDADETPPGDHAEKANREG